MIIHIARDLALSIASGSNILTCVIIYFPIIANREVNE